MWEVDTWHVTRQIVEYVMKIFSESCRKVQKYCMWQQTLAKWSEEQRKRMGLLRRCSALRNRFTNISSVLVTTINRLSTIFLRQGLEVRTLSALGRINGAGAMTEVIFI